MSGGSFNQVNVICPFYRADDGKRRITCEGIIDDSTLILAYRYGEDYKLQMLNYCFEHYAKCEIYKMLMEKYKEEAT